MSDLLQIFGSAIVDQAKQALAGQLQGELQPIQAGTQGDFPWFWQDTNGNLNQNTFDYVSRRAVPGSSGKGGPVSLPDSFVNAYSSCLDDLVWKLSSADQALINKTQIQAQAQAGTLVSSYEQNCGPITAADLDAAKAALGFVVNKLDFVVSYAVGYLWSGAKAASGPPLTRQQMAAERNLASKLPAMPASGDAVLANLGSYLAITASILGLIDSSSNANWLLGRLRANVQAPSAANGGIQTIDSHGNTTANVGYKLDKVPAAILASLTSKSSLKVQMQASRQSASQLSVSIQGKAAGVIPIDFVSIGLAGGASYSLFEAQGSGSSASIEMEFPGLTPVAVQASGFSTTTQKGWIYGAIISQAVRNADKDETGWHFSPKPGYDFVSGGNFGLLATLVICGYPTIRITYSSGDYSAFSQEIKQDASVEVKLFGFRLGGIKQNFYKANSSSSSQSSSFTLTLAPPDPSIAVAPLDQLTYVLGGIFQYPGDGSLTAQMQAALAVTGGQMKVSLGGVSFSNQTGGAVEVYSSEGFQGRTVQIPAFGTSGPISGRLLTIDVVRQGERTSYDMANFWPNGLLVEDESPYFLKQVLDRDGRTQVLVITDNRHQEVGTVRPAMAHA